jgi:hypothetical protein
LLFSVLNVLLVVGTKVAAYCQETTKAKRTRSQKQQKGKETKEPRRQKPHKPEKPQLSYKTLLFVLLFFLIDVISYALCLDNGCSIVPRSKSQEAKSNKSQR